MLGSMKRLLALSFVLLCGCAGRSPTTDAQRFLGHWVVVDFQSPFAAEDRSQRRKKALVSEETWSQQFRFDEFEDFEYTLDPTKSPKQIDLTFTVSKGKRLTVRGIYELPPPDHIGDRMRVCFGSPPVV